MFGLIGYALDAMRSYIITTVEFIKGLKCVEKTNYGIT